MKAKHLCLAALLFGIWGMATTPKEYGSGGFASLSVASAIGAYLYKDE